MKLYGHTWPWQESYHGQWQQRLLSPEGTLCAWIQVRFYNLSVVGVGRLSKTLTDWVCGPSRPLVELPFHSFTRIPDSAGCAVSRQHCQRYASCVTAAVSANASSAPVGVPEMLKAAQGDQLLL